MQTLGIFVKQPVAGRVKTRLADRLGDQPAGELYAAFVADLAERFRRTADRRWLCYSPDDRSSVDYFRGVAGSDYELWPQPAGCLGERLTAFFDHAMAQGARRTVVIGSDSPTLPAEYVARALELLKTYDCVLGPTTDGGYYLIGQRGRNRPIFDGITWSTPHVLRETVTRIRQAAASLALLPVWYDVDTFDDWILLQGHVEAMQSAGGCAVSPEQTARCCREIASRQRQHSDPSDETLGRRKPTGKPPRG